MSAECLHFACQFFEPITPVSLEPGICNSSNLLKFHTQPLGACADPLPASPSRLFSALPTPTTH